jgi:hypothetical protein
MIVTPVVGWMNEKPVYNFRSEEVVFLIDSELRRFLEPSIVRTKPYEIRGELLDIKYFDYDNHTIWGATAMILNELLTIIKRGGIPLTDSAYQNS